MLYCIHFSFSINAFVVVSVWIIYCDGIGIVVDICNPSSGAGRENIWPMVHKRKEIPMQRCQSHQPTLRHRKLGRGSGSRTNGVEGECIVLIFSGDRSLFSTVCDALSAVLWSRPASFHAPAGVLSLHSSSKLRELGLGIHFWGLWCTFQDALFSLPFSIHRPGNKSKLLCFPFTLSVWFKI